MSLFIIFYSLLIIYVTFQSVTAKPTDDVFYLETLNFEHENDKWICGDVECPEKTFGCKIRLRSDGANKKMLHQSFTCFDREKQNILGAVDIIQLPKAKIIDIELESFDGAESVYSIGYGGHESAKGVVAVNDLNSLKETARKNKEKVGESNT